MPSFEQRSTIGAPPEEVFAWHARPGALERLSPPWERVRVVECEGGIEDGATVVLELRRGPVRRRWVARHRDFEPGRRFVDEQVDGPFARWLHSHTVEAAGDGASVLEDAIDYALPLGPVGAVVTPAVERTLRRTFRFRHDRLAADLARHAAAGQRSLRVAVTGASGLIGAQLVPFLTTGGHRVETLVRRAPEEGEIGWDPAGGVLDPRALGTGFLAEVCRDWEAAADPAREAGIRVVTLRTGVVLSPAGGALAKMLRPFSLGLGGPVGSGDQWLSWIGLDDAVGAVHHLLLADSVSGPVNLTAPAPATSRDFARTLGRVLLRPAVAPLPAVVVSAAFGEMGRATLLEGQRVLPGKLESSGFRFLRPTLEGALRAELGR